MSRIERKTFEEMAAEEDSISLGENNFYKKSFNRGGNWVAITEWHKDKDGYACGGWVPMNVPELDSFYSPKAWTVVSLEPLHIEPSLLCSCGNHGFIRNGQWVAC